VALANFLVEDKMVLLQDTSGIAQGIQTAGTALAKGIEQRIAKMKEEEQRQGLIEEFGKDTVLGKVLSQPGGSKLAQGLAPLLGPMVKQESYAQASKNITDKYTPIGAREPVPPVYPQEGVDPSQQQQQQQPGVEQPLVSEPPIQTIKANASKPPIKATEGDLVLTKDGSILKKSDYVDTPMGSYHPNQILDMAASPNPADQKQAELINKYLVDQEKLKGKESSEIRKEWRGEIKEYAKPYMDMEKLKMDVHQIKAAKRLIESSKNLSLDDNWVRSIFNAIASDKGWNDVSQLAITNDQRKLAGYMYDFLRTKELGGSNPSTKEVQMSLNAKPSRYLGKDANTNLINLMLDKAELQVEKSKIIDKTRATGESISPSRFKMKVSEELQPFMKKIEERAIGEDQLISARRAMTGKTPDKDKVFMMLPNSDKVTQVEKKNIKRAQNSGGRLLHGLK
jgi:hypothetical protein